MKKYKLLRFGHCYVNRDGTFIIGLVGGNKRHGYTMLASHAHPYVFLQNINVMSRIVPNDGNWMEITPYQYNAISSYHADGYIVKPSPKGGPFVISKFIPSSLSVEQNICSLQMVPEN